RLTTGTPMCQCFGSHPGRTSTRLIRARIRRNHPIKVPIHRRSYSTIGEPCGWSSRFEPTPMLRMGVRKRQNVAYIVPGPGAVLPGTRVGLDGEITVVHAVLPFVDEDEGFCGRRTADVTFLQVGGIACD